MVAGAVADYFPVSLPYTVASDFAGVVEHVGSSVTQWKVGDAVIAWNAPAAGGGLAELAAVPAASCVALPTTLQAFEGAGIPTAASTAWHALFSIAQLKAGETVLIHGAAGGVGTFAVQFAHKIGAHVVATTSGDAVALVRQLGAAQVIDYTAEDFATIASNVDVVIDLIGGEVQSKSYGILRKGGRLISTVATPDEALAAERGVTANMLFVPAYHDRLGEVVQAIVEKGIKVVVGRRLLSEAEQAWGKVAVHSRGKTIITIE
ncbi:NADP-dependent oxidoreductase [Pseudomonas syringae group sp. J309-1]|nr:NADP-dependent oxidoreductase [Pseudomonas syringae group sp. J309-1]MDU8358401.1 NADP-dependent oxidoreductase [Pseudomonas syringae group sp. J309-1]